MITCLVFDFGNVVAFFDHRLTTNRLAPYAGISADAIHGFLFGSPLEKDFDAGRISTTAFLSQVRQTCRLECSDEFIVSAWADIFWPNRDVIALLPKLAARYRLILASNTNELHTRQFVQQFESELQPFHARVFSHDVGARKPDRSYFEQCSRRAPCKPDECLFIDDLEVNVAGAREYGWNAFAYRGIDDLRLQFAEFGIHGNDITSVET
jgi:putative hydrolase of the HAD superfamily